MISIIIPIYQQSEMTDACLDAIANAGGQDYELILVDNGSIPPYQADHINSTLIRNEINLGFPVAVNQGIKAAKGDIIVLLNNDVIVTENWFERLEWHLLKYDIVGPMTNYASGMQAVTIPVYHDEKELNQRAIEFQVANAFQAQEVNWVIGFCMAFKKSLYDELGEFDESLWPCSGEEIDFCLSARKAGHKVGIAKDVYVHHFGSQTFNELEKAGQLKYDEICTRNDKHITERHGEFWGNQKIIPEHVDGIRLNMGSGPFPMKGFINIDQFKEVNPDLLCDVTKLSYEPGTVAEIYAGHILEHFKFNDGMNVLKYWHSLLIPGGIISVVVPDYDFLVKEYVANPSPESLIIFNDVYIYSWVQPSPHQYAYSGDLLKKVMVETGFKDLKRMPVDHHYFPFPVEWQTGYQGTK